MWENTIVTIGLRRSIFSVVSHERFPSLIHVRDEGLVEEILLVITFGHNIMETRFLYVDWRLTTV